MEFAGVSDLRRFIVETWSIKTCSKEKKKEQRKERPYVGHDDLTTLLLNNYYGGEIKKINTSQGDHYYLSLKGKIYDFTVEQFMGEIPQYENGEVVKAEDLLNNEDTNRQRDIKNQRGNVAFKNPKIKKLLEDGAQTAFEIWYEYDKSKFENDPVFKKTLQYIKRNNTNKEI